MKRKIKLDEITPEQFADARKIIHAVIESQSVPADPKLGSMALAQILDGYWKGNDGLSDGLDNGLSAELDNGLSAGLDNGLSAGLDNGLSAGLDNGLSAGLHDELSAGLHDELSYGLRDGLIGGLIDELSYGLRDGLIAWLSIGLRAGLSDGLDNGLYNGLIAWLSDGLDNGLDNGLSAGLSAGLRDGLSAGLDNGLDNGLDKYSLKFSYCGVFWSWWLIRYLIAQRFGCEMDDRKILLLRAFCLFSPIVGECKEKPVVLPKPSKIRWSVIGKTAAPFEFPIYALHGDDGLPSVEYHGVFNLYHINNVRVPGKFGSIKSEKWSASDITKEVSEEVRRVLIERFGWERYIKETNAKTVHTRFNERDHQWERIYVLGDGTKRTMIATKVERHEVIINDESRLHAVFDAPIVSHQGDIMFLALDELPKSAKMREDRKLAQGDTQGSRHIAERGTVYDCDPADLQRHIARLYTIVIRESYLGPVIVAPDDPTADDNTHPEHGNQGFPAGTVCAIVYQRSLDADEREQRVLD